MTVRTVDALWAEGVWVMVKGAWGGGQTREVGMAREPCNYIAACVSRHSTPTAIRVV